jgi:stearoyl-CoA desaturase (delta-9 desaturase)
LEIPVKQTVITVPRHDKPNWFTASILALFHIGAVAALFMFSWRALAVTIVLYWITMCFGISMGYHRLHTHRSYRVPLLLEYFFAVCGTLTLEGGPIFWVATHRIHHQFSDKPGDPHSPREGGLWAHIGWLLVGESKHSNTALMGRYAPDLWKDSFYRLLNRYHYVPVTLVAIALFYIGGWPMLLWPIFFRVAMGLHFTWLVNSATHMWGSRRFKTRDDSRNSWWVALLTFGEGWHNNHHAHPVSARHGLAWYELDITWLHINLLKRLGIAKSVKVASLESETKFERAAA